MNEEFPQTQLSVLEQIRNGDDNDRKIALELFIEGYRPALVNFLVRCKKVPLVQAEDLVHEFLINKVISGKLLNYDEGKGRFRNLLRVALQRDFLNEVAKNNRIRETPLLPDDLEPKYSESTDFIDEAWAIAVFGTALYRLKTESKHWGLFFDRVLTQPPLPYEVVIEKYAYESPERASNFLMTAKRKFNRLLLECIREQSTWTNNNSENEFKQEVDFLCKNLRNPNLLREAIRTVDYSLSKLTLSQFADDYLSQEEFEFIENSADQNWSSSDNDAILSHVLRQPLATFEFAEQLPGTVGDAIGNTENGPVDLVIVKHLKDHFNRKAKSGKSYLPTRIQIAMTYAAIAKFVSLGGELSDVTSIKPSELPEKLRMLVTKRWIPDSVKQVFHDVLDGHEKPER